MSYFNFQCGGGRELACRGEKTSFSENKEMSYYFCCKENETQQPENLKMAGLFILILLFQKQ